MSGQEAPKSEDTEPEPSETTARRRVTPEEFITRWPLYTPAPIEGFHPPARVSLHCYGPTCAKETTWLKMGDVQYLSIEGTRDGFKWVWYLCGLCNKEYLAIMYRDVEHKERRAPRAATSITPRMLASPPATETVVTKIQKIGQYPAQSIGLPKGLEKNLGEQAISLYKKGLINRNYGYGLGAVTYIRRVVEDKTNELIEVAALLAESYHVDPLLVKQIRAATTERTTYDQKLKIAATVLPETLLIDGINPLGELYNLVSEGVHGLSEEECIAVADETTSVFEFVFTNLRAQTAARQGFVDKVKKWAGRGSAQRQAE